MWDQGRYEHSEQQIRDLYLQEWESLGEQQRAAEARVSEDDTLENREVMAHYRLAAMDAMRRYLDRLPPDEAMQVLIDRQESKRDR